MPSIFIVDYPNGFHVFMKGGRVEEFRHDQPGYVFRGRLQVGSSLEEVLAVVGRPKKTVEGKPNKFKDGIPYKDIDGKEGRCYYHPAGKNVRLFFANYRAVALYVTP